MAKKQTIKKAQPSASTTPKKSTPTLPDAVIAEQLQKSMGNISHAARSLGMNRSALHDRISRTPELVQVVQDARETIVDAAENALYSAVVSKQGWAVCFTLKTIGQSRGYIEKQQIEHSGRIDVTKLSDEELQRIIDAEG